MDNELYHYGILGMRWGIRKSRSGSGGSKKTSKKRIASDDAKDAMSLKKKKVYEMSNAELRRLNDRQNLEKTYRQNNKSIIAKGLKFVTASAALLGTGLKIYSDTSKLIEIGEPAAKAAIKNVRKKAAAVAISAAMKATKPK